MRVGRHAAFSNPLYFLVSYGLHGFYTPWLIARGGLVDLNDRPVAAADFGDTASRAFAERAFPRLRIDEREVLR